MSEPSARRSRRGASAIEFAIWLPILLMLISAVVDWGLYMTTRVTIARAVMEGTRRGASVFEPSSVPPGTVIVPKAEARTALVLDDMGVNCAPPGCTIDAQFCQAGDGGACADRDGRAIPFRGVVVRVTTGFEPFFGFVPIPDQISESFLMAVENQGIDLTPP
jgi:hypothetical protein